MKLQYSFFLKQNKQKTKKQKISQTQLYYYKYNNNYYYNVKIVTRIPCMHDIYSATFSRRINFAVGIEPRKLSSAKF